jgi:hypothetical protein
VLESKSRLEIFTQLANTKKNYYIFISIVYASTSANKLKYQTKNHKLGCQSRFIPNPSHPNYRGQARSSFILDVNLFDIHVSNLNQRLVNFCKAAILAGARMKHRHAKVFMMQKCSSALALTREKWFYMSRYLEQQFPSKFHQCSSLLG